MTRASTASAASRSSKAPAGPSSSPASTGRSASPTFARSVPDAETRPAWSSAHLRTSLPRVERRSGRPIFTTRPEIAGTFGVVASTHWLASQVGMAVLERGGNAFDAAVAAAFTLHVAEPHLNGPGGDAPIILHSARTGTQHVICGQGVAPQAATLERFAELGVDLIPATGLLPAVVPGAFDAWCLMLRDWGSWEFRDVLEYAIGYARNGAPVMPRISATIEGVRPLFEAEWKTSAAEFLPN